MNQIIGRSREREQLESLYQSKRAEFVVVYGRRRIGKTFLVREHFAGRFSFAHTALSPFELIREKGEYLLQQQLSAFANSLREYGDYHQERPKDWFQAFQWLKEMLQRQSRRRRLVVFLDELPWLDTPRSGFVTAFEHFWNGWGAGQHRLMLIVCGSAASWINDRLLNNTGGMYGRTTREIHLSPFTLSECEQYFTSKGIVMDHYDLLQCHMILGGIPYYMSYLEKGKSLSQNIDLLFFSKGGKLQTEFVRLFDSLFVDSEKYMAIAKLLSKKRGGYTRKEIVSLTGMASGGSLTTILQSLEASDFIVQYIPFCGTSRDTHYRLTDLFTLFYLHFIESKKTFNPTFWQDNQLSPSLNAWRGLAFEEVCYLHRDNIKRALGISGVQCEMMPWQSKEADDHTQIDMVIDRADRVVNICEMKFSAGPFLIDKAYDADLRRKIQSLMEHTHMKKNPHLTFITTYGLKQNAYSGHVQNEVCMDDLF